MKSMRVFVALLMVVLLSSCTEGQRAWLGKFLKGGGGSAVPVAVEQVVVSERSSSIVVPATLAPSDQVQITLPYEAHVERVLVNVGEPVKSGAALCRLSADDAALRLAALRAEAREAQANLEKNQYFLKNRDRLLEEGRLDKNQYDNLEAEVNANEGAVERLRAQVTQLETQTGNVDITSPITGIVQARYAGPGVVIPERQPLFVITKVDPMNVVFSLAPYEAKAVRVQTPVSVKFMELPGEAVQAVVTSVGSAINPQSGRFDVAAQLPNQTGVYKTGMAAQVEFAGAEKQRYFSVPSEAVITDNRRHYVFTVSMGTAHKVPVVVRESKDGYTEVIEGLMEGDLIVVKGSRQLKEGAVVDIWR